MASAGLPRDVGREFFASLADGRPSVQEIMRAAAVTFDCSYADIMGRSRAKPYYEARHAGIVLCTRVRNLTYSFLAQKLSRDHTTIIHASNSAVRRILDDPDYEALVRRTWDLACRGKPDIASAEQERLDRIRIERAAKKLKQARNCVEAGTREWTARQLVTMNETFGAHIAAYGGGARY